MTKRARYEPTWTEQATTMVEILHDEAYYPLAYTDVRELLASAKKQSRRDLILAEEQETLDEKLKDIRAIERGPTVAQKALVAAQAALVAAKAAVADAKRAKLKMPKARARVKALQQALDGLKAEWQPKEPS